MPPPVENKSELRRKKKSYYAALKKQEDNKLAELAEKYRDRARERRDGINDISSLDPTSNAGSAYRYKLINNISGSILQIALQHASQHIYYYFYELLIIIDN